MQIVSYDSTGCLLIPTTDDERAQVNEVVHSLAIGAHFYYQGAQGSRGEGILLAAGTVKLALVPDDTGLSFVNYQDMRQACLKGAGCLVYGGSQNVDEFTTIILVPSGVN